MKWSSDNALHIHQFCNSFCISSTGSFYYFFLTLCLCLCSSASLNFIRNSIVRGIPCAFLSRICRQLQMHITMMNTVLNSLKKNGNVQWKTKTHSELYLLTMDYKMVFFFSTMGRTALKTLGTVSTYYPSHSSCSTFVSTFWLWIVYENCQLLRHQLAEVDSVLMNAAKVLVCIVTVMCSQPLLWMPIEIVIVLLVGAKHCSR